MFYVNSDLNWIEIFGTFQTLPPFTDWPLLQFSSTASRAGGTVQTEDKDGCCTFYPDVSFHVYFL